MRSVRTCVSAAGPATRARSRAGPPGREPSVPPRSAARRRALRRPLSLTSAGSPTPSSATVSSDRSRPRRQLDLGVVGGACRATLDSASRSTASSWSPTRGGTAVSTGPVVCTDGREPEHRRRTRSTSCAGRRAASRRARPLELEDRPADALMVTSRSSMARSMRLGDRAVAGQRPRRPGAGGRSRTAAGSPCRGGRGRSARGRR